MNSPTPSEIPDPPKCPKCGSPMRKKAPYRGGTASYWEVYAVSSTGSASAYMYPEQEIFHCTNPNCGKSLLKPSED